MSEQKNELRQIITDALVSMVSGVTGLVPPSGPGAIPDFIQAPIDRAVERISASLPVGVPDDWRRAIYQAEECLTGCLAAPDIARALDAETVRKIIADLQSARFGMLAAVQVTNFKKAQPEVAENTGSHAMANQLQRQGLTVSAEVDGAATPGEASDADDRKCEAPNCGCADAFCKAWPDQDDFAAPTVKESLSVAPTVKAEQVQCEVCNGQGEVYSGHDRHFHYFDFQPPEPIMDVCPECGGYGGEEAPSLPAAGSADHPYQDGIAEDLERSDWTPLEALQWYAAGKHFDVVGGRTRIIDTGAVASNALKHASLAYLELKGNAELSELRAALSAHAAGSAHGISLPSVSEFGEWVGPEGNGPDSATRGMLLALFKWTLDRVCALNANHAALSAQQSAPERVSVLREALEDARRAMFAVLNQEPRMKAVAKRVLNAEIDSIDRALLASHGRGEA